MTEKRAFALGFFDGMHRGHTAIFEQCAKASRERGLIPSALAFDGHPRAVTRAAPPAITSPQRRIALMREQGALFIASFRFDEQAAGMAPEAFIQDVLIKQYDCALCVCGDDFRFGKGAAGTPELIATLGLPCITVPPVMLGGQKISSTLVRQCVLQGDMPKAAALLGRSFMVEGDITHGRGVGRTLGFPTVNIGMGDGMLTPKYGVYSTNVTIGGKPLRAVTNVGVRPTFGGSVPTVESYIFDFTGTLYGERAEVGFKRFLRPERAFESAEALAGQIARDVREAEKDLV